MLLDSLAAGADLLCAEEAVALGYSLEVPLPFDLSLYYEDFTETERIRLDQMLKASEKVFVAPQEQGTSDIPDKSSEYRSAGIYIAQRCDVLLALWDGVPGDSNGCGTSAVYQYRKHILQKPVIHIMTRRR